MNQSNSYSTSQKSNKNITVRRIHDHDHAYFRVDFLLITSYIQLGMSLFRIPAKNGRRKKRKNYIYLIRIFECAVYRMIESMNTLISRIDVVVFAFQ